MSRRTQLERAKFLYYEGSARDLDRASAEGTLLTDAQYDDLEEEKYAAETGYLPPVSLRVRLPALMPSLRKIKTARELGRWADKCGASRFLITPKLDGVSFLALVVGCKLKKLYTRGNGVFGRDITYLYDAGLLPGVGPKPCCGKYHWNAHALPAYLVRGELVIEKDARNPETDTRRLVSGFVNSSASRAAVDVGRRIRGVIYEVVYPGDETLISHAGWKQESAVALSGFPETVALALVTSVRRDRKLQSEMGVEYCQEVCGSGDLERVAKTVMAESPYPVDGVVIECVPRDAAPSEAQFFKGDLVIGSVLNLLSDFYPGDGDDPDRLVSEMARLARAEPAKLSPVKRPKYKIAYKGVNPSPSVPTKVVEVQWRAASTGLVIPRLLVEAVSISGRNVSAVAAHNARYILDRGVGPGTDLSIKLGGGIVPAIASLADRCPTLAQMPGDDEFGELQWHGAHLRLDPGSEKMSKLRARGFFSRLHSVKHVTQKRFSRLWESEGSLEGCLANIAEGGERWKRDAWSSMISDLSLRGGAALLMYASGVFPSGISVTRLGPLVEDLERNCPDLEFSELLECGIADEHLCGDMRRGLADFRALFLDSPSLGSLLTHI